MTIAGRNKLRILGILISLAVFIFAAVSCAIILFGDNLNFLPEYLKKADTESLRIIGYSPRAVCVSIFSFSFLSLFFLCYIYFIFKKIHAVEISFFRIFIFSFAFEAIRLVIPFYDFSGLILVELTGISRAVYFFRFIGLLSLFIGNMRPVKNVQGQSSYIIFIIIFLSFSLSMTLPMSNTYITEFFIAPPVFIRSYTIIAASIYILSLLITAVTYAPNGLKDNILITSVFLIMIIGYTMLLFCSNLIVLISGLLFFFSGTFMFIKKIHGYYLWQ